MDGRIVSSRRRVGPFGFRRLEEIEPLWRLRKGMFDHILVSMGSSVHGSWTTLPYGMQKPGGGSFSAAHSALLHNGKVLLIAEGDSPMTVLWDPTNELSPVFLSPDNQPTDPLFCSGHAFLSDGQLLVAGGGGNPVASAISSAWRFDPSAGTNGVWAETAEKMDEKRWYPTVVNLGHPYLLVAGGVFGTPVQQATK